MQNTLLKKGITLSVIVLLTGMSIPTTANILEFTNDFDIKEATSSFFLSDKRFYAVRTGYPDTFVWFDPEEPSVLHEIGTFPNNNFAQGSTFVDDVWWVCDTYGNLFKVDEKTGDYEFVGNSGTGELVDIAYHENSKILYGISTKSLYTIDLETGKASLVGSLQSPFLMITMDCDKDGVMYAYDLDLASTLYTIDLDTGKATPYCSTFTKFSTMSYDIDEDIMWGYRYLYQGELWTMDMKNCTGTFVGYFQNGVQISCLAIPYEYSNQPPDPPIIKGPTKGIVGAVYDYNFTLFDPNNNILYLRVDWGIGCPGKWHGPFASGTIVTLNYSWQKKDSYTIRAQSRDIYGLESNWSYLDVKIPKNMQSISYWWFIRLLDSIQYILFSGK